MYVCVLLPAHVHLVYYRLLVRLVLCSGVVGLLLTATSISWMKLDDDAYGTASTGTATAAIVTTMTFLWLLRLVNKLRQLGSMLRIKDDEIIRGDLKIGNGVNANFDILAELNEQIPASR